VRRRLAVAAVAAAVVSGCAAPTASAPPSAGVLRLPVSFPVLDLGSVTPGAELRFIPGGIFGRPDREPVLHLRFEPLGAVEIDLAAVRQSAAKAARAADAGQFGSAVTVTPAQTRIARVGTFTSGGRYGTGIVSTVDKADHLLVYFDRACEIRGVQRDGDLHIRYDLVVPGEGLHWIVQRQLDDKNFTGQVASDVKLDLLTWEVKRRPD
jgi:hypothetical protein